MNRQGKNRAQAALKTPNTNPTKEEVFDKMLPVILDRVGSFAETGEFSTGETEDLYDACVEAVDDGYDALDRTAPSFWSKMRKRIYWRCLDFTKARRRRFDRVRVVAIEVAPASDVDSETHGIVYEDTLAARDEAGIELDPVRSGVRASEIREAFDRLPAKDQQLCLAVLAEGSPNAASRALGFPQGSRYVDRRLKAIQAYFRSVGLAPEGRRATPGFESRRPRRTQPRRK